MTEVSITPFANDFSKAEVGDTVKVYIDGGNELQYFNGSLRVTEKNVTYSGSDTSVIYQLSTSKVFTPTLIDEVRKLRDRVKKIEL